MLTPDQRALLGVHLYRSPGRGLPQCSEALTFNQIGADIIMGKRDVCPTCRADLSVAVLKHVAECTASDRAPAPRGRPSASWGLARRARMANGVDHTCRFRDIAAAILRRPFA